MLSNVSYDTTNYEMAVTFTNGKTYTYINVDRRIYDELIDAKSAGKYFNNIKKELKQKS